ncbi:MAG: tRNA (adenosine(37)-N6)-threonylcarbamoyltransferase complex dimerization subunit type 1 TsaB, partial [Wenzhouxiangellaceae bacterium]
MNLPNGNLLAIETATRACSVALIHDGRLLQRSGMDARMHAEVLLPWIGELLAEAGIGYHDLDALAVDRGPGGFTSLRIGLGIAQGIALAHDLPCHPVSSLAALALAARPEDYKGRMLAAIDARMGEIYAGWFDFDDQGKPPPRGPELLLPPADLKPVDDTPFIAAG